MGILFGSLHVPFIQVLLDEVATRDEGKSLGFQFVPLLLAGGPTQSKA